MGMIYKRGEVFWIKYYSGGRPIRESTGTSKQKQAERFLKDREGRVAMGAPILPKVQKTTVCEMLADLKAFTKAKEGSNYFIERRKKY